MGDRTRLGPESLMKRCAVWRCLRGALRSAPETVIDEPLDRTELRLRRTRYQRCAGTASANACGAWRRCRPNVPTTPWINNPRWLFLDNRRSSVPSRKATMVGYLSMGVISPTTWTRYEYQDSRACKLPTRSVSRFVVLHRKGRHFRPSSSRNLSCHEWSVRPPFVIPVQALLRSNC